MLQTRGRFRTPTRPSNRTLRWLHILRSLPESWYDVYIKIIYNVKNSLRQNYILHNFDPVYVSNYEFRWQIMPPGEFRGVPVTSILGVSLGNACLKPDGWAAYMVIHGRGSPRVVIRSLSLTPHYQSLFGPCDVTHWRSWTRVTIGACCFLWVLADLSRPRYSEVGRVYPLINLLVRHRIDSRRTEVSNINWANGSWMVKADYHL